MTRPYTLGATFATSLSGASQGCIDLGAGCYWRKVIVQAQLKTNGSYDVLWTPSNCSAYALELVPAAYYNLDGTLTQPNNDAVEVLSSDSRDAGIVVRLYGTTTAAEVGPLTVEEVTIPGAQPDSRDLVPAMPPDSAWTVVESSVGTSVKTNWGDILGVELSKRPLGTITVREASGNATMVSLAPGTLQYGVKDVPDNLQSLGGLFVSATTEAGITDHIGVYGQTANGLYVGEGWLLTATVAAVSAYTYSSVRKLLAMDVTVDKTVALNAAGVRLLGGHGNLTHLGTDEAFLNHTRYVQWALYNGTTLTAGGANDYLITSCYG